LPPRAPADIIIAKEGRYTDTVDDALLAVMSAKTKKVKIA